MSVLTGDDQLAIRSVEQYCDHKNTCANCKQALWCETGQHLYDAAINNVCGLNATMNPNDSTAMTGDEEAMQ